MSLPLGILLLFISIIAGNVSWTPACYASALLATIICGGLALPFLALNLRGASSLNRGLLSGACVACVLMIVYAAVRL